MSDSKFVGPAVAPPVQLWSAKGNGELDDVNGAVLEYFGRTREEMLRWGWAELVHEDDLPSVGEHWSASLETGQSYRIEFRLRRHDGKYFWHLGRATATRDAQGKVTAWVGANTFVHGLIER